MEEKQWKGMYRIGAIAAALGIAGALADIVIGSNLGVDLTRLPQTAMERFALLDQNPWLGLYQLDLLNLCTTLIALPLFLAVYGVLRDTRGPWAGLAAAFYLIGAAVFLSANAALPIWELSHKYVLAGSPEQRALLAAAGEALLARGAHGSPGAFAGFALLSLANILLALAMLRSRAFPTAAGIVGLAGFVALLGYVVAITFVPASKPLAMLIAAPGGILAMFWQGMVAWRLWGLAWKR